MISFRSAFKISFIWYNSVKLANNLVSRELAVLIQGHYPSSCCYFRIVTGSCPQLHFLHCLFLAVSPMFFPRKALFAGHMDNSSGFVSTRVSKQWSSLGINLQAWSQTQWSTCRCLPSAAIKDVYHLAWLCALLGTFASCNSDIFKASCYSPATLSPPDCPGDHSSQRGGPFLPCHPFVSL